MTPSGAYRHAHVAQGQFFHPKDAMRHNRDISGAWSTFVLDKSEGFTQAGVERLLTRSAHMFGLSWERKPRRGRIFSRPGRDLTPRNNFWLISKMRLPRPLTSPVASLAIRKHCTGALPPLPVSASTRDEIAMPMAVRIDAMEYLAHETRCECAQPVWCLH